MFFLNKVNENLISSRPPPFPFLKNENIWKQAEKMEVGFSIHPEIEIIAPINTKYLEIIFRQAHGYVQR